MAEGDASSKEILQYDQDVYEMDLISAAATAELLL